MRFLWDHPGFSAAGRRSDYLHECGIGQSPISRPAGRGPLVIALAVPGLSVHNGAEGALVLRQGSRAVLGYGDLAVRDATGSAVPALSR